MAIQFRCLYRYQLKNKILYIIKSDYFYNRRTFFCLIVDSLESLLLLYIMKEILRYKNCFVCGEKNIGGLKAKFFFDGENAFTDVVATDNFEGYNNIYHGGVIASLLDEVMIKVLLAQEIIAVTAEMTIKYKRPVQIGTKLRFTGSLINQKGKLYYTEGELRDDDNVLYASATGKYIKANDTFKAQLMKSID